MKNEVRVGKAHTAVPSAERGQQHRRVEEAGGDQHHERVVITLIISGTIILLCVCMVYSSAVANTKLGSLFNPP